MANPIYQFPSTHCKYYLLIFLCVCLFSKCKELWFHEAEKHSCVMFEIPKWFGMWQKGPSAPSSSCRAEASVAVGFWGVCAHALEGQGLFHACVFDT